jgi:hypothetical protein
LPLTALLTANLTSELTEQEMWGNEPCDPFTGPLTGLLLISSRRAPGRVAHVVAQLGTSYPKTKSAEERLTLVRAIIDEMGIDPNHIAPLF